MNLFFNADKYFCPVSLHPKLPEKITFCYINKKSLVGRKCKISNRTEPFKKNSVNNLVVHGIMAWHQTMANNLGKKLGKNLGYLTGLTNREYLKFDI